jgi:DNA-binding beta-propeller fold protein YncE
MRSWFGATLCALAVVATFATVGSAKTTGQPSAQGLYVTSTLCGVDLTEFQGAAFKKSGKPAPTLKPIGSSQLAAGGIAFDTQQILWVPFCLGSPFKNGVVLGLSPANIRALSEHKKKATLFALLNDESVDCPRGVAVDHERNLWVANNGQDTEGPASLAEYAAADIAKGGSPAPTAVVELNGYYPNGIAFDSFG